MKLFGKIEKLVQLLFSTNGKTVVVNPPSAPGQDQTFILPDLNTTDTHTLVTTSLAQTLTNKTINGDNNTTSNLPLSSLKTVAGRAYRALFRDSSGVVTDDSTGAMVPPSGTTAERPSGSTGMVRYNSTLNQLEVYNGTLWNNLVKPAEIIHVAKSGGDFTSIQAAIDSISDASSSKPYVIRVYPGVFTENVTLKDWVFIENGISGAVKIIGSVTATGLTGTSGIKGVTIEKTPTAGGQYGLSQSGGIFIISDLDIYILGSANYAVTGALLSSGTALTIFNSTVWDRRTGNINTNFDGWSFAGSGTYGIFNASVSARGSYIGGTHCLFGVSCTGSFTMSGGAAIFGGTGALGSGVVYGFCVSSTSASPRFTSNLQVRLTTASGGTGVGFSIDSASADFQHIGSAVSISGFTAGQEYITDTASGDTQKLWSCSTNKYLTKTGSGTAIVTPLDDAKSGFLEFAGNPSEGSTTFWSWASPNLTVSLAGSGIVRGAPVSWSAGQSVALTDLATNYIYMNSAGVIGSTTTANEALFADNVVLLEAWRDGTTLIVSKENHPYKFDTAVSHAWHRLFGVLLEGTGTTLGILSSSARTLTITGTDVLTDHGLDTAIPADTGPLSVNYVWTNDGTGKARFYSTATAIPDQIDNGSTTASITNNKYVVFRFYVTKNNLNATTPQYFSVLPTLEYTSLANAQAAIANGTIQTLPPEIAALECAQIAYVICFKNSGGVFSINSVIVEKQTFTARFLGSSPASSAGLVTTDTSNFGGILSGADVNVQAALDTIDDAAVVKGTGTYTDQALVRYNGTGGQLLDDAGTTPATMSDAGVLTINNTTASTDKDTGALIVEGGVGVEEDLYAGGQVVAPTVSGTTKVTTPTLAPVAANGVMTFDSTSAIIIPKGTTEERPTAAEGQFRYNSTEKKLEVYNGTAWVAAGAGASIIQISYTGTLAIGTPMYLNGSSWTKADSSTSTAAEVVGIISKVVVTDTSFELTTGGEVVDIPDAQITGYAGAAVGTVLFLDSTAGLLTTTEPTTVGYVSKPMGVITTKSTGANKIVFMNMRGASVGGTNLYTTIGLANNATTSFHTIQGDAGTGGWLSGTIVINATTDYVIPFFCHFSRQLDGTTYNVSAQFGDSIPTGLSITNSGSSVQVVMPNFTGGETFVSASVTYCVQAAASGTTLPVSLSASSVLGSTSGSAPAAGVIGENTSAAGSNTVLTTATWANVATLSLNKGTYIVYGCAYFELTSAITSCSDRSVSISTTSVTPTVGITVTSNATATYDSQIAASPLVLNISADSTTVYLVAKSTFVVGTGGLRVLGSNTRLAAIRIG